MASDKQQFQRANARYQELLAAEQFSVADEPDSVTAILVPYVPLTNQPGDKIRAPEDAFEYLEAEALGLVDQVTNRGRQPELILHATVADFQKVLLDRQVAVLVVCGLGNFSAVQVAPPDDHQLDGLASKRRDGWLRWNDVSFIADHLKQRVEQRFCGWYNDALNVPFGWGIVRQHYNIWAQPGREYNASEGTASLRKITGLEFLSRQAINELFPRQHAIRDKGVRAIHRLQGHFAGYS